METTYNPQSIEQTWYKTWEDKGYFTPQCKADADNYCIMIPPPNVTGTLHMGHAFQDTIMDALTRYHRMMGDNTLWQPGTDHAGIATQMVVERQLAADGKSRHDLGRDKFIEKVWDWKEQSGGAITQQLRRMGGSLDWAHERFTMDEGLSDSVHKVFIQLYDEGLIYRGKRLVNWDPVLHTALSDLEVISEEESGHLWHMRYPLSDGPVDGPNDGPNDGISHLVVATTRPETMLGDSAVAVHPDDERFKHLIGSTITLPLVGREIPIIGDDYVDMEFGSGCVKITPAHDFNDYEMGQRHALPIHNIFTVDACINDECPKKYQGIDRYEVRDMIIHDLKELDLLEKIDDHKLMVPRGDRSGSVVEPYLTDQWYVKIAPLAEPAIAAVKNGDIKFVPENWNKTYYEWMNNIQDWCISRQIWWGHRIPAWYDDNGKVYVADSEAEVRTKYTLADDVNLKQDDDVLDTWFSSALWPFSTLGWPEETDRLKQFYPTSVLVTGFDIIFFWVARMIMFGLKFKGEVPFKEIYIHGLVRDADGQKMSKSKGNVLDPIDIIDGIDLESLVTKRTAGLMQPKMAKKIEKATRKQFPDGIPSLGTDALRFTFASQATTGRDVVLSTERISGNRNFCNKIWNATRYVLMNTENQDNGIDNGIDNKDCEYSLADRWIRSRIQGVEDNVHRHFESYRFDLAAQELYSFIWEDYCDWYLELSKPVLLKEHFSDAEKRGTRQTLVKILETILRLVHPIMPFITEELWQKVAPLAGIIDSGSGDKTIMNQPYPVSSDLMLDKAAEEELEWVKLFVMGVRRIRSESDIAPGKPLPVILQNASDADKKRFKDNEAFVMTLAKLESVDFISDDESAPESSTALIGEMKILIPLAGLIDKDAETARLKKEIAKLQTNCDKSNAKLNNPGFVDKAPEAVVNKEKERVAEMQSAITKLQEQLQKISAL